MSFVGRSATRECDLIELKRYDTSSVDTTNSLQTEQEMMILQEAIFVNCYHETVVYGTTPMLYE